MKAFSWVLLYLSDVRGFGNHGRHLSDICFYGLQHINGPRPLTAWQNVVYPTGTSVPYVTKKMRTLTISLFNVFLQDNFGT
jgi:hypothetical protein